MKRTIFSLLVIFSSLLLNAQDFKDFHLYNPSESADSAINAKLKEAKKEGKHLLIQVGGNWCIWCYRYNDFVTKDASLDSLVQANYIVYHMNWSKENYNDKMLAKYQFPQRFGFPVFLILDNKGHLLHTQNSGYLEDGKKGYEKEKVKDFLEGWTTKALDPETYKKDHR